MSGESRLPGDADSLAHELRTPLSVIAGYAELLAIRDDDETRREAAAGISKAVARLGTLVDELAERAAVHDDGAGPKEDQQVRETRDRLGRRETGAGPSRRVLIVDDDPSLRHLVRMTLPSEGFDILEAHDGTDALEQIRVRVPDLVVLDWNMPERSGSAVLDDLQTSHPDLPVIVLTAERRTSHKALARALGARIFLTKPFSPLELLATVEALLAEPPRPRGRWTN
jgi:CheY-like chemotaxis protein